MKVKVFKDEYAFHQEEGAQLLATLEEEMNVFLAQTEDIEIIELKFSTCYDKRVEAIVNSCLVCYSEN